MDLSQLQTFDQVVRQGSFSKAARLLNISQPTISLRVQALEQEVGGTLFLRGGNRLSLTELGRAFLPYARQAIDVLSTGVEVAHHTANGKRDRVVLGTLPFLATCFFSAAINRLNTAHPGLDIAVHTGHSQQIVGMLYDGFIHAGFVSWPFFSPNLSILLHVREPLIVVTYASHPLAGQEMVEISELKRLANPFFQVDWNAEVKMWETQVFDERSSTIEVPPQTAHDLLLHDIGVALLPRSQVQNDLRTGQLVEITVNNLPILQRESALVHFKHKNLLPASVYDFIQIFSEEASEYCIVHFSQ